MNAAAEKKSKDISAFQVRVTCAAGGECENKRATTLLEDMESLLMKRSMEVPQQTPTELAQTSHEQNISEIVKANVILHRSSWDAKDWPMETDICCYWCRHQFTWMPLKIPLQCDNRTKMLKRMWGNFCSFSCCKAYAISDKAMGYTITQNIWHMSIKLLPSISAIPTAPNWQLLSAYGGPLTISNFREMCLLPTGTNVKPNALGILRGNVMCETIHVTFNDNEKDDENHKGWLPTTTSSRVFCAAPIKDRIQQLAQATQHIPESIRSENTLERTMGLRVSG